MDIIELARVKGYENLTKAEVRAFRIEIERRQDAAMGWTPKKKGK